MVFRHVDYMAELIGIDHVGFGSDWMPYSDWVAEQSQLPLGEIVFPDNGYTAQMAAKGVPTPDPSSFLPALIDTMLEHGYSEEDCAKFVGGNSYRVYKQVWKEC